MQIGAETVADSIERELDGPDLVQVAHQFGLGRVGLALAQAALEIDLQAQGQEAGDDVPEAGVVTVMEDGSHLERGLLLAEGAFHPPQTLLGPRHLGGAEGGAGA